LLIPDAHNNHATFLQIEAFSLYAYTNPSP
jgi:hypothetical protein